MHEATPYLILLSAQFVEIMSTKGLSVMKPPLHPLKLGYLIPQFPGQTHIFFWREIAELEARGVEVQLLSTQPPPKGLIAHDWSDAAVARTYYLASRNPLGALRAALPQPWGKFVGQTIKEGSKFAKDLAICLPAAARLAEYARTHQLDHIHVHSCGRAALIAAMAKRMGGPNYSLTLHGPMSDYGSGQAIKWGAASFATVITHKLLAEARAELGRAMPARARIRPMGVDTEVLRRDTPYVPHAPGAPLRLFSCARLNVVKGHQDVMQAVAHLRAQGLDVDLEIAGEDDAGGTGYRQNLEARILELNLQDNVRLLGAIDAQAVRQKLLDADIFVLASWHEPLGVAYMEAMSCGVPTIGTDAGGVPELITSGETALLVPPKSPDDLAKAIAQLASDPDTALRLSQAGRAHIEQNFKASLGAETLIKEITHLCGS